MSLEVPPARFVTTHNIDLSPLSPGRVPRKFFIFLDGTWNEERSASLKLRRTGRLLPGPDFGVATLSRHHNHHRYFIRSNCLSNRHLGRAEDVTPCS